MLLTAYLAAEAGIIIPFLEETKYRRPSQSKPWRDVSPVPNGLASSTIVLSVPN